MTETIDQRAKRLGYPAELQSPTVRPRPVGLLSTDRDAEDLLYAVLSEKMRLLMEHYGIEETYPQSLAQLAFHLAQDWVPGFQIVDKAPPTRGAAEGHAARPGSALHRHLSDPSRTARGVDPRGMHNIPAEE
jgi:hypothetical protein